MSSKSKSTPNERRARAEQLKAEREAAARASERRTRLFIVVAVLAAVVLIAVAVLSTRSGSGENAAVPAGVEAPDGGAPYGDDSAPVVMNEWIDFSCPACATFTTNLGATITEQVEAGQLKVFYHPLSFINTGSELAANAFGCAIDQDRTHEFYNAVFAVQGAEAGPGFTNEQLIEIGAGVGLDNDQFASCVNDGTYAGWVDNVDASQVAAGVTGTPTIFLNGELVDLPSYEPQALLDAIAAAAASAGPDASPTASPTEAE